MSGGSSRDYVTADLGAGVRVCATTRAGGASVGAWDSFNLATHVDDDPGAVASNRELLSRDLAKDLGIKRIQWLNQVHGVEILRADRATTSTAPEADAAFTTESGLALAVLTADCLPVVLVTDEAVGVAHCGWRGLAGKILPLLAAAMPGELRSAWLGPGICGGCYQVEQTLLAEFDESDLNTNQTVAGEGQANVGESGRLRRTARAAAGSAVAEDAQEGKVRLSLPAVAGNQLIQIGCEHIIHSNLCSLCDERFYSYRRRATTGRMATLVSRH